MEDDKVVTLPLPPAAAVAAANRAAAGATLDHLPTPLEIANATLKNAAEAVEALARIAENSPDLLPLLVIRDRNGGARGVVYLASHIQELAEYVRRAAQAQCIKP